MDKDLGVAADAAAPSAFGSSPVPGLDASHSVTNAQRGPSVHTPGPLVVRKAPGNIVPPFYDVEREDRPGCVARVFPSETAEADAHLYAAAHRLLAALTKVVETVGRPIEDGWGLPGWQDHIAAARAAIAEAEAR